MCSKEFAFCNKILYKLHPYLHVVKMCNCQLCLTKHTHKHTHTHTVSKKLLCREHASYCLLGKSKVRGNCTGLTNIILTNKHICNILHAHARARTHTHTQVSNRL